MKGFTLIELIVVISVIAILAGIITPVAGILIDEARKTRAIADCDAIGKASLMYDMHFKYLPYAGLPGNRAGYSYAHDPAQTEVLNNLLINNGQKSFMAGRCVYDPWATAYKYHNYTEAGRAILVSCHYGANKANNGVWNWNLWAAGSNAPSDDYYKIFK